MPIVTAVVALTPAFVRPDGPRGADGAARLDLLGAVLLTGGPVALVYGVLSGSAPAVVFGLALLAAFVLVEARSKSPLVPLSFFTHRTRAVANAATVPLSVGLSTTFFLATLYLQDVIGLTPLQAGLAYLPFCAALLVAVSQVSRLIRALGTTRTSVAGLLLTAAGLAWLARLPDAGTASGVQRSVDQLGGSLGLAVLVGATVGGAGAQVADFRAAFAWAAVAVLVTAAAVALAPRQR
ncbi:hypothetical protein [Streptomyces formicae]|uniref:Transmembrane efflux protein n=1 Tax=Streptomyces formicae TaxID=1616117 RepID=A0A291QI81_9ACTN|nr:hypothetical protein [Streptomyces formicae]ATL31153.1 Putative transmembrane efflux protein [Streptomyces formicae]